LATKQPRQVCNFLQSNERIAGYLATIERNAQLLRKVRRALPSPLDEHCLHASLQFGVLTLVTDSPVWSSRLRFFARELERNLIPHQDPIRACRIRIQPPCVAPSRTQKHKLSLRTAQHLLAAAAGIEDAQLASALRRLAGTGMHDR
jgi:hypothetical protein